MEDFENALRDAILEDYGMLPSRESVGSCVMAAIQGVEDEDARENLLSLFHPIADGVWEKTKAGYFGGGEERSDDALLAALCSLSSQGGDGEDEEESEGGSDEEEEEGEEARKERRKEEKHANHADSVLKTLLSTKLDQDGGDGGGDGLSLTGSSPPPPGSGSGPGTGAFLLELCKGGEGEPAVARVAEAVESEQLDAVSSLGLLLGLAGERKAGMVAEKREEMGLVRWWRAFVGAVVTESPGGGSKGRKRWVRKLRLLGVRARVGVDVLGGGLVVPFAVLSCGVDLEGLDKRVVELFLAPLVDGIMAQAGSEAHTSYVSVLYYLAGIVLLRVLGADDAHSRALSALPAIMALTEFDFREAVLESGVGGVNVISPKRVENQVAEGGVGGVVKLIKVWLSYEHNLF